MTTADIMSECYTCMCANESMCGPVSRHLVSSLWRKLYCKDQQCCLSCVLWHIVVSYTYCHLSIPPITTYPYNAPPHLLSFFSIPRWLQHTLMSFPYSGTCHGGYGTVIPSWNGEGGGGWFQGLLSSTPPSHPETTSVSPSKPSKQQIGWSGQEDYGEHCNSY